MSLFSGITDWVGDLLGYGPKTQTPTQTPGLSSALDSFKSLPALINPGVSQVKSGTANSTTAYLAQKDPSNLYLQSDVSTKTIPGIDGRPTTFQAPNPGVSPVITGGSQPRPITYVPQPNPQVLPSQQPVQPVQVPPPSYNPSIPQYGNDIRYNNPYGMALSGQSGTSGAQAQSFGGSGGASATSGASGIEGGVSSRTGLLQGVGSLGMGSTSLAPDQSQQSEQEKKNQLQQGQQINNNPTAYGTPFTGQQPLPGNPAGSPAQPDGQGGFILSNGQSSSAPASYLGTPSGTLPSQFNVQTPTGPIPASTVLDSSRKQVQDLLAGGKITSQTADEFYAQIDNYKTQLLQLELQNNPLQARPHIQETADQSAFLAQFQGAQKGSVQQQMDAASTNLGIPQINADIFNKTAEINATVKAYQEIIKDIRDNPELPKGLASRRISEFTNKNGIMLQNLNAELSNLTQKRAMANDQLNQQFQIIQADQSQQNQNRTAARELLNTYISSGAIAQFNSQTLAAVSLSTGISVDALNAIKSATVAKTKQYAQFSTETNARGDLTVYGIRPDGTVDTLKTLAGAGKPTATSVANSSGLTPAQTQNFIKISDTYQKDEVIKQAEKSVSVNTIANQVIADPSNAAKQLTILYTLVKNLDPNSAVREGELALAQSTQSYLDKYKTSFERITSGKIISSDTAVQLAQETINLANIWQQAAVTRTQKYDAQASVSGLGAAWNEYKTGWQAPQGQNQVVSQGKVSSGNSYTITKF